MVSGSVTNLPLIGVGTFQLKDEKLIFNILERALSIGIRLIDTAQCYKNEQFIASSLESLLPKYQLCRSDIIIVSKLHPKFHGKEKSCSAIKNSVSIFGGYVDVMLIHWPGVSKIKSDDPAVKTLRKESWETLESYHKSGKIKQIGVSNYKSFHLQELLSYCSIKPMVLQNEFHPRYIELDVQELCKSHGITFMGYSPFGQGSLLSDPIIVEIAQKYSVKPAHVLIKWSIQNSVICIPRTTNPDRIDENFQYDPEFVLSAEDLEKILTLNDNVKVCWDPSKVL